MADPEIEERIRNLARELREILQTCIAHPPHLVNTQMRKAGEIEREIESYGYPVKWEVTLDENNPEEINVVVTVWQVKENLSPEDQKIYDAWFLGRQKITGKDITG